MTAANGKTVLHMALAVGVSFFLYFTGLGLPIFIFPLLLVAVYHGTAASLVCFLLEAIAVTCYGFIGSPYFELFPDIAVPLILIELYVPLSLSAAGAIWIASRGRRLEERLGLSILPSAVCVVLAAIASGHDTALSAELTAHYGNVFETVLTALLGGAPSEEFMNVFMGIFSQVSMSLAVPLTFCFTCVSCFLYESNAHSGETDWEERVMGLELDGHIIWGLIACIAGIILMRFVMLPPAIGIVLTGAAICFAFLYFIQGFSVVYHWIGTRTGMKSVNLFMVLGIILLLAQGINIILFFVIAVIGMAETFFDLRRQEKDK